MNEEKLKHLEFIQSAIARIAQNSFLVKGWSATLMTAFFALGAKDLNGNLIYAPLPAIILFWWLDAFFLSTERRFRKLYEKTASLPNEAIDFSMDVSRYLKGWRAFASGIFAKTVFPFHGTLLLSVFLYFIHISAPPTTLPSTAPTTPQSVSEIKPTIKALDLKK